MKQRPILSWNVPEEEGKDSIPLEQDDIQPSGDQEINQEGECSAKATNRWQTFAWSTKKTSKHGWLMRLTTSPTKMAPGVKVWQHPSYSLLLKLRTQHQLLLATPTNTLQRGWPPKDKPTEDSVMYWWSYSSTSVINVRCLGGRDMRDRISKMDEYTV